MLLLVRYVKILEFWTQKTLFAFFLRLIMKMVNLVKNSFSKWFVKFLRPKLDEFLVFLNQQI